MIPLLPDASAAAPLSRLVVDIDLCAGRVALIGALTGSNCHHLDDAWSALCGGAHPTWQLDLAGLIGCDAAGMRALRDAPRTAAGAGAVLIIRAGQPQLRRLLSVAGLSGLLAPPETEREKEPPATTGAAALRDDRPAGQAGGGGRCGQSVPRDPRGSVAAGAGKRAQRPGRSGNGVGRSPSRSGVRREQDLWPSTPEPIRLAAVGQQLVERGCDVDLFDVGAAGDVDIRLLVRREHGPVSVEVLGPCDGPQRQDCWCAVRAETDGVSCVWAGPARCCPATALVTFVEALLDEDPRALAGRYLPIG